VKTSQERLRRRYQPTKVRLLFVGESPPASGRFFYQRDSGLYRAIRDAFCALDPSVTDEQFLGRFQSAGCYLIDVCAEPVDHLDGPARRASCLAGEPFLSRSIRRFQPAAIVILLRSIQGNVRRAAERAGWRGPMIELPYPGRWVRHREAFLRCLVPQLREHLGLEFGG